MGVSDSPSDVGRGAGASVGDFASVSGSMKFSFPSSPSKKLGESPPTQMGLGSRNSPSKSPTGMRRARSLAAAFGDGEAGKAARDTREEDTLEGEQTKRSFTRSIDTSNMGPNPGFECWKIASSRGSEALGMKETEFYAFGGTSLTRVASSFESPERRKQELEEDIKRKKRRGWGEGSKNDPSAKYWAGQKKKSDKEWEKVKSRARREDKDKDKENKSRGGNGGFWMFGGKAQSAAPESPVKSPAKKRLNRGAVPAPACLSMNGVCILPRSSSEPSPEALEASRAVPEQPIKALEPASLGRGLSLPIPSVSVAREFEVAGEKALE